MCSFIQAAGANLELPILTICTACVFFQRFFSYCSFAKHDPDVRLPTYVACCSAHPLFLLDGPWLLLYLHSHSHEHRSRPSTMVDGEPSLYHVGV
jgi:hypothetical protein